MRCHLLPWTPWSTWNTCRHFCPLETVAQGFPNVISTLCLIHFTLFPLNRLSRGGGPVSWRLAASNADGEDPSSFKMAVTASIPLRVSLQQCSLHLLATAILRACSTCFSYPTLWWNPSSWWSFQVPSLHRSCGISLGFTIEECNDECSGWCAETSTLSSTLISRFAFSASFAILSSSNPLSPFICVSNTASNPITTFASYCLAKSDDPFFVT